MQIRVHLQHLGHPIANDVQYGGDGRIAYAHAPAKERVAEGGGDDDGDDDDDDDDEGGTRRAVEAADGAGDVDYHGAIDAALVDDVCPHCPRLAPEGWDPIEVAALWLHAKRYRAAGGEFDFEGPDPGWAAAGFEVRGEEPGHEVKWELAPVEEGAVGNDRKRMRVE